MEHRPLLSRWLSEEIVWHFSKGQVWVMTYQNWGYAQRALTLCCALKQARGSLSSEFMEHIQEKGPFERKIKQQLPTAYHRCSASKCTSDWQGFWFQTPQSCQHQTSAASCLPRGPVHKHKTHFFYWPQTLPFCLWPRSQLWGLSQQFQNLSEEPLLWCFSNSNMALWICSSSLWTHRTPLLVTSVTTEPRSQTCVNWAWHSVRHQDTRAADRLHPRHCWHYRLKVLKRTVGFDLCKTDSVTQTMFAACICS